MHRWNRGFLLVDSLLSVFIVASICLFCFSIYQAIDKYAQGYKQFQKRTNETYEHILNQLPDCEACQTDESDS
ncbi:MAG: hypothetical protein IJI44_01170 [Erysipelotrichaceae bacterium]|nr:hypothetical protein [Erysipelotrichaceae bacterium]